MGDSVTYQETPSNSAIGGNNRLPVETSPLLSFTNFSGDTEEPTITLNVVRYNFP